MKNKMSSVHTCRVCAKMFPPEEQHVKFDIISSVYFKLTALQPMDNQLPDTVCSYCYNQLLLFDNFRKMCLNACEQLSRTISFINLENIKVESGIEEATESNLIEEHPGEKLEVKIETLDIPIDTAEDECFSGEDEDNDSSYVYVSVQQTNKHLTKIECSQCDKYFYKEQQYKLHLLSHQGIQQYFTCHICGAQKASNKELKFHIYTQHVKPAYDKQHPCGKCDAVFGQPGNLKRHMQVVHQGVKNFRCSYCDRAFGKAETLKNHVMIHTGEKPHECQLCGKRFRQLVALQKHLKSSVHKF